MTNFEVYLSKEGVQPCGHSARASGILLYLAVSCRPHKIPHKLYFSTQACSNDKNTKEIFIEDILVAEDQHSDVLVTCGAESYEAPCLLADDFTWSKRRISKRVNIAIDCTKRKWYLFVLIDDCCTSSGA